MEKSMISMTERENSSYVFDRKKKFVIYVFDRKEKSIKYVFDRKEYTMKCSFYVRI